MKHNLIIWDLDDTLINSQMHHIQAYIDIFNELGLDIDIEKFKKDIDTGASTALENQDVKDIKKVLDMKAELFEKYKDNITLNQNALEILKFYKNHNITQCILTNASRENTNYFLNKFDLNQYFIHIQTRDSHGLLKPDIRRAEYLMKLFWSDHEMNVLYIGDSENDRIFAENAGWDFRNIKDFNENI